MSGWLVILTVLLAVFSNYRVSRMIALEDGPFNLFQMFRDKVFEKYGNGWIHEGVNCPLCIGFWTGTVFAVATVLYTNLSFILFPLLWLGIAGMSTFLYKAEQP